MLYPAQLYRDEIKNKTTACWYQPKYKYYFTGDYHEVNIADNADYRRDFACVNNNEVIGYFSYFYNEASRSMVNFGLISFVDNGSILIRDVVKHIKTMLENGAQRIEFWFIDDNPVQKLYYKLLYRYGGRVVGYLKRTCFFDGKFHNTMIFEFTVEDYQKACEQKDN